MKNLILLLITLSLPSCISLQPPQVKGISNVETSGLLSGHPRVNFNIQLYNPNAISIYLTDFNVNVNYGSISLASLQLDTLQEVAAQSNFMVPLSFSPSTEQLNTILFSGLSILNQEGVSKINGTGSARVRKYIFNKTFSFSY